MSRIAEVIVLAQDADEVMEPLTRPDDTRPWRGSFSEMRPGGMWGFGWGAEFVQMRPRSGLLKHLESLAWPRPETLQVLIHDEEDDCFGLWMIHDGRLTEIPLPRTRRYWNRPHNEDFPPDPGILRRTDSGPLDRPEEIEGGDRSRPPAW
ncbi:hypothetical protein [Streptomyces hiroshimensis]|uniref:Uncharacterized protein n=1 Tax=Streptomyces hiroshimensis TaxID=66424 RepID=A0ABQ2YAE1_9ACTN|nr:hypothetical protein [Streptomyces hiroshimensis]GGX73633.1 hypothetical protein GCM10010324_18650 [Streptomyces hiroshimensis]